LENIAGFNQPVNIGCSKLLKQFYDWMKFIPIHEKASLHRQLKRFLCVNCCGWLISKKIRVSVMLKHQPNQRYTTTQDCRIQHRSATLIAREIWIKTVANKALCFIEVIFSYGSKQFFVKTHL